MTISTIFTKIANLFLRVFLARVAGSEILGSYLMILPIIGLLINISQAGLPTALFTMIASDKKHQKHLMITSFKLCFIQFIFMLFILFFCHDYFSLILPYIFTIIVFVIIATFDAIFRSYFLGNEKGHVPAISQIIEECVRLFVLFYIFYTKQELALVNVLNAMLFGEFFACLYMVIQSRLYLIEYKKTKTPFKDLLSISLPTSLNSLILSFTRFLEPVIFKNGLLRIGFSTQQINIHYGVLNGCVFSVLMIPTFLNNIIYKILLPKLSNSIGNKQKVLSLLSRGILICFCTGLPFSILFAIFPHQILKLLFNSTTGATYLSYLAIPILFFYIQTPLQAYLQVRKKQKQLVLISIIQSLISLSILYFFLPTLKEATLVYSFLCNLILNTLFTLLLVFQDLFIHNK